MAANKKR